MTDAATRPREAGHQEGAVAGVVERAARANIERATTVDRRAELGAHAVEATIGRHGGAPSCPQTGMRPAVRLRRQRGVYGYGSRGRLG